MKKMIIGLFALYSVSALAGFEPLDDAQLSVTSRNGDISASVTVSVFGVQAKRIFDALETAYGSKKTSINDSLSTERIESRSQEVICMKQQLDEGSFYSCVVGKAL